MTDRMTWEEWIAEKERRESKLPRCMWCNQKVFPTDPQTVSAIQGGVLHHDCVMQMRNGGFPV